MVGKRSVLSDDDLTQKLLTTGEFMVITNGAIAARRIERDDGEYYIENNLERLGGVTGNGFLLRRCKVTLTSPHGWECIGAFFQTAEKWLAKIDIPEDPERSEDYEVVGIFVDRGSAIEALWNRRHDALCRHENAAFTTTTV
jgi:hypothetical protein